MAGYKAARLSEDVRRELSLLVRDLKDPRIKNNMISIVRVEMANDGSFAKAYVSAMEGMTAAKLAVKALSGASGRLRRDIANKLHLRKAPELRFLPDDSMEYSARLGEMLEDIRRDEE